MKLSGVNEIYFSPTGGTKTVVELLANQWQRSERTVDLTSRHTDFSEFQFGPEDFCVIGVPSYAGRVPAAAAGRIKKLSADRSPALLVVAYGNRNFDDTLLELKNLAEERGFLVVGAVAAVTEHSILRQFGAGRPDCQDKKELREYGKAVLKVMEKRKQPFSIGVPGKYPYRDAHGSLPKPKAGNSCEYCGLCSVNCPVGAIPVKNPRLTNKEKCISCMRCIQICPRNVRGISPVLLWAAGKKMKRVCSGRKANLLMI